MSKNRRKGISIIIVITLLFVAIGLMCYYFSQQREDVAEQQIVDEIKDEHIIEPDDNEVKKHKEKYGSDFDKWLLRKVDIKGLQKTNQDVKTWLFVPDTNIDNYVMQEQTVNEYYYSQRNLYRRWYRHGSYLIPKSPMDLKDCHTLVLGHKNYRMGPQFGQLLPKFGTKSSATAHRYVYFYYADHSERWEVWCSCDCRDDDMVYELPYELGTDHYKDLISHMGKKARVTLTESPDEWTETTMLSTCNRWSTQVLGRFVVCLVPNAKYYYKDKTYIEFTDEHQAFLNKMQEEESQEDAIVVTEID